MGRTNRTSLNSSEIGKKQSRRAREKIVHENQKYTLEKHNRCGVKYYRCQDRKCSGRLIVKGDERNVSQEHDCRPLGSFERTKDAAMEKLRELTLASNETDTAFSIVRKVLQSVPPHALHLMPNEDALRRKVMRWAKQANIQLAKSKPEDFAAAAGEGSFSQVGISGEPPKEGDSTEVKFQLLDPKEAEEEYGECSQKKGLFYLKSRKANGHYRVMIDGHIYHWNRKEGEGAVYRCHEARIGCQATATVIDDKRFEVVGVHDHTLIRTQRRGSRWYAGLKRVDEQGNIIGAVSLDEMRTICSGDVGPRSSLPDDGGGDEFGDDDFMDYDNNENDEAPDDNISPNLNNDNNIKPRNANQNANHKSGERCCVCGDELMVSETVASSLETFRKACCYLNVKSEMDWFPQRVSNWQFNGFCESCTKEITRIHGLYKQVEEIQSLIFKKIETVEQRIADAEIVDNWMAEAPPTAAVRFEGFRKQVLINYKNKLKLRREIRVGRKMGQSLMEIQPITSVHMFASNPAETDAFRKLLHSENEGIAKERKGGVVAKKRVSQYRTTVSKETFSGVSPEVDDEESRPLLDEAQDDYASDTSEKEVKFWHADPSKLGAGEADNHNNSEDECSNEIPDTAGDEYISGGDESGSDPDYNVEDDEDWTEKKKKNIKSKPLNKASESSEKKKGCGRPSKNGTTRDYRFPDCILTKDNRIFMKDIEIIKMPPGSLSSRPFTTVFSCGACGKIAVNFWTIRQHICGHHLGLYKCTVCGKEFSEPRMVARHMEQLHEGKVFCTCEICGRPLKGGESSYKYHRWRHLNEEEKADPQYKTFCPPSYRDPNRAKPPNFSQTYQCCQCGKTFYRQAALKKHELVHSGDAPKVQCQYCGKLFSSRKGLSNHVRECPQQDSATRKWYPCPKCPARLKHRSGLKKHLRTHGKPTPFACPRCHRKFCTRNGYKNHKRVCFDTKSSSTRQDSVEEHISSQSEPSTSAGITHQTDQSDLKGDSVPQQQYHDTAAMTFSYGAMNYPGTGYQR